MKILFVTEGGRNIGYGHITRCLALYQAFEEKGMMPELIVNGDHSILHLLKGQKHQIFNWIREKSKLFKILKDAEVVVVDSYLAPPSFYKKIAKAVSGKIVMIDDNNRLEYPGGVVVNPSIYGETLKYPRNEETVYLLGKNYIILRKDFWKIPRRCTKKRVKDIFVSLGGAVHGNFLNKLLKYLSAKYPTYTYHVVAQDFKAAPDLELALNIYHDLSGQEMCRLMLRCDLCITAGGQTLYELVRSGNPIITICLTKNQELGLKFFRRYRCIEEAGSYDSDALWQKLSSSIKRLLLFKNRVKMIKRQGKVIDGQGARRVATAISKLLKEGNK